MYQMEHYKVVFDGFCFVQFVEFSPLCGSLLWLVFIVIVCLFFGWVLWVFAVICWLLLVFVGYFFFFFCALWKERSPDRQEFCDLFFC